MVFVAGRDVWPVGHNTWVVVFVAARELATIGDGTQKLYIGFWKLDNLNQQVVLVEELRGSTIMRDLGYNFTREVDKYMVEEVWGPGKGHPGNKIPNSTMVSAVGLGLGMVYKGAWVKADRYVKDARNREVVFFQEGNNKVVLISEDSKLLVFTHEQVSRVELFFQEGNNRVMVTYKENLLVISNEGRCGGQERGIQEIKFLTLRWSLQLGWG